MHPIRVALPSQCSCGAVRCIAVLILSRPSCSVLAVAVAFRPIVRPPHPALPLPYPPITPAIAVPSADQEFLVPSSRQLTRCPGALCVAGSTQPNPRTHPPRVLRVGRETSHGKQAWVILQLDYAWTPTTGHCTSTSYSYLTIAPPLRHILLLSFCHRFYCPLANNLSERAVGPNSERSLFQALRLFQATARHWRSAEAVHFRKYTLIIKNTDLQGPGRGIRLRKAPQKS